MQKINFGMVVLWTGQKCTLRCKDCCNLIPYLDQISYDKNLILKSLNNLLEIANVNYVQIQGGEPFTHQYIDEIILAVNKLKIPKTHLSTNGTIPINEKIVRALKKVPQMTIGISDYEATQKTRKKFISILESNEINHNIYNFLYANESWFSSGSKDEPRNNNDKYVQKMYSECDNKVCVTLADGFLYTCGKIKAIRHFNNDINFDDCSSVNLLEENIKLRYLNLLKFINKQSVFKEECRYCRGTYEKIPAGIQF